MVKSKALLKLALEELEIEKVVQGFNDAQPVEQILKSVEEDSESDKLLAHSDTLSKDIDEANNASTALEEIANIVRNSINTGGLTPSSINVLNCSLEAICNPFLKTNKINSVSFENYSKRINYTTEALSNIKELIKKIWDMIIAGLTKLVSITENIIELYKRDVFKLQQRLSNVKNKTNYISKAEPTEKMIGGLGLGGSIGQLLVTSEKAIDSASILNTATITTKTLNQFISSSRRDLGNAVNSINNFSDKVLNIPMGQEELEKFNREDLVKYGDFFGTHLSGIFDKATNPLITKPTNTIISYISKPLAGNYQFTLFAPDKVNLKSQDILSSKLIFLSNGFEYASPEKIEVCEVRELDKIFDIVGDLITNMRRGFENGDYLTKEVNKLLKLSKASKNKALGAFYEVGKNMGIETNYEHGVHMFQDLVSVMNSFYIKPYNGVMQYLSRYIRALIRYIEISVEQYI